LEEHFDRLASRLQTLHNLENVSTLGAPQTHDVFTVIGRICTIKTTQNAPPTPILMLKNGQHIKMDLVHLSNYSLFPGQIVAVKASNPYGVRLICQEVYTNASLPNYTQLSLSQQQQQQQQQQQNPSLRDREAHIIFASGPFTSPTNWKYEPLVHLLKNKQPDLFVLVCVLPTQHNTTQMRRYTSHIIYDSSSFLFFIHFIH
jgi:DNA polymerase alpha subunit B